MKKRLSFLLLALAVAILWLRPATPQKQSAPAVETVTASAPPAVIRPAWVEDPALIKADAMAQFINGLLLATPTNDFPTRSHLRGIQAIFFASDYLMAAKTNSRLLVSKSAILAAFANVSLDSTMMNDRLSTWARRPYPLSEHYQHIGEVPDEAGNIKTIKAVMANNGVPVDLESDLLMDCIRYAVHNSDIREAYGPNPRHGPATPDAAALLSLSQTGDAVFLRRFTEKYGLDPATVTNLMNQIRNVRIYGLSDADIEIPVVRFQGE